nr:immunoglobulin light chain junction region [Macaca mulatta]
CHQYYTPPFTF